LPWTTPVTTTLLAIWSFPKKSAVSCATTSQFS